MEQKKDFSNLFLSHSALIFLKASETRNFSETAKFFRITQSAVSRSMREWEKSWGCPLFDRSSRPIFPWLICCNPDVTILVMFDSI